jgi:hypothetical protein
VQAEDARETLDYIGAGGGRVLKDIGNAASDLNASLTKATLGDEEIAKRTELERQNPIITTGGNIGSELENYYKNRAEEAAQAQALRGQDTASKIGHEIGAIAPYMIPGGGQVAFGVESALGSYGQGEALDKSILNGITSVVGASIASNLASKAEHSLVASGLAAAAKSPESGLTDVVGRYIARVGGQALGLPSMQVLNAQGIPHTPEQIGHTLAMAMGFGFHAGSEKTLRELIESPDVHPTVKTELEKIVDAPTEIASDAPLIDQYNAKKKQLNDIVEAGNAGSPEHIQGVIDLNNITKKMHEVKATIEPTESAIESVTTRPIEPTPKANPEDAASTIKEGDILTHPDGHSVKVIATLENGIVIKKTGKGNNKAILIDKNSPEYSRLVTDQARQNRIASESPVSDQPTVGNGKVAPEAESLSTATPAPTATVLPSEPALDSDGNFKTHDDLRKHLSTLPDSEQEAFNEHLRSNPDYAAAKHRWLIAEEGSPEDDAAFEAKNQIELDEANKFFNTSQQALTKDHPTIVKFRADLKGDIDNVNFALDPVKAFKAATVLGYDIYKKALDFTSWSKEMFTKFGETIKPYLRDIFNSVRAMWRDEGGYIGEGGKIGYERSKALNLAKMMEKNPKYSSEDIRAITGWFKGKYDEKWRYEVGDEGIKFKQEAWDDLTQKSKKYTNVVAQLHQVLDHSHLFEIYPELKDVEISRRQSPLDFLGAIQGWFDNETNTINISPKASDPLSTLRHEIQHWIQSREGFATGGSQDTVLHNLDSTRKDKVRTQVLSKLDEAITNHTNKIQALENGTELLLKASQEDRQTEIDEAVELRKEARRLYDQMKSSGVDFKDNHNPQKRLWMRLRNQSSILIAKALGFNEVDDLIDQYSDTYLTLERTGSLKKAYEELNKSLQSEYEAAKKKIYYRNQIQDGKDGALHDAAKKLGITYDLYRQIAGEIEARDVQARMEMTPAERKAKAPYTSENIPRENAIVKYNSDSNAMSAAKPESEKLEEDIETSALGYNKDRPDYSWREKQARKIEDLKDSIKSVSSQLTESVSRGWTNFRKGVKDTNAITDAIYDLQADKQLTVGYSQRLADNLRELIPSQLVREAIDRYIDAGGDRTLLEEGMNTSPFAKSRREYEMALNLKPEEKAIAANIQSFYDAMLQKGIDEGIIGAQYENYINRIYKRTAAQAINSNIQSDIQLGKLPTNFKHARKRVFETLLDAEKKGFKAKTTDIADLVPIYNVEFGDTIAARRFVQSVISSTTPSGEPIIIPKGSGGVHLNDKGDLITMVNPNIKPRSVGRGSKQDRHKPF